MDNCRSVRKKVHPTPPITQATSTKKPSERQGLLLFEIKISPKSNLLFIQWGFQDNAMHKKKLKLCSKVGMFPAPVDDRVLGVKENIMAKKAQSSDHLAVELRDLLELGATERISRNRCFDRFSTPFGRRLFAYYRTCMSLKKEIEDPKRNHRVRMSKGRGENFLLEIVNDPIAYRRTATLPSEVRDFFEGVIQNKKVG